MSKTVKAESHATHRPVARLFTVAKKRSFHYRRTISGIEFLRGPQPALRLVLAGTFLVVCTLLLLLCVSYFVAGNTYVSDRIFFTACALFYVVIAIFQLKKQHFKVVAWMLIALYIVLACTILIRWGINAPVGILILGFIILLSGVLLGAKYIIPVTLVVVALLILLQYATSISIIRPDLTSLALASGFGDVASYGVIFGVFALVAWMSGRRMEQSLQKALRAETALELEKSLLAERLEQQTRHLREVQFEEMRQLYQFAELGQVSTALLHELANHLTVLTLDIDDLQQRHRRSKAIIHAKESISNLDAMVSQVRKQLHQSTSPTKVDVSQVIEEVIETVQMKANESQVQLLFEKTRSRPSFHVMGDPLRLSQIITIILTNAIQAYTADIHTNRVVEIHATQKRNKIVITVNDWGGGISSDVRKKLFIPFQSKKKNGMGIGLFIAKNMIETHFKGSIQLDKRTDFTSFIIELPEY